MKWDDRRKSWLISGAGLTAAGWVLWNTFPYVFWCYDGMRAAHASTARLNAIDARLTVIEAALTRKRTR